MAYPLTPAMLHSYAQILDTRDDWPAARTQAARLREVAAALTRGEAIGGRLLALNLGLFVIGDYAVDLNEIRRWVQIGKKTAYGHQLPEAAASLAKVPIGALIENQHEADLIALARTHLATLKRRVCGAAVGLDPAPHGCARAPDDSDGRPQCVAPSRRCRR